MGLITSSTGAVGDIPHNEWRQHQTCAVMSHGSGACAGSTPRPCGRWLTTAWWSPFGIARSSCSWAPGTTPPPSTPGRCAPPPHAPRHLARMSAGPARSQRPAFARPYMLLVFGRRGAPACWHTLCAPQQACMRQYACMHAWRCGALHIDMPVAMKGLFAPCSHA